MGKKLGEVVKNLFMSPQDHLELMGYKLVDADRRWRYYELSYAGRDDTPVFDKYIWNRQFTEDVPIECGLIKRVSLGYDSKNDTVTCRAEYLDADRKKLPYTATLNTEEMTLFTAIAKDIKEDYRRGWC